MTLILLNEQTTLLGESDVYFPGEQNKKMSSLITFKLACVVDVILTLPCNKYLFFPGPQRKGLNNLPEKRFSSTCLTNWR